MPALVSPADVDAKCAAATDAPQQLSIVASAAFSLAAGRISTELSLPKFIDEVLAASSDMDELKPDPAHNTLAARLAALLSVPAVAIGAKAATISVESERHLTNSRILTDARPIFADDEIGAPLTTIILHTIKLEYHEDGEFHNFFASLDLDDLKKLKSHIDRALAKATALQATFQSAGLPISELRSTTDGTSTAIDCRLHEGIVMANALTHNWIISDTSFHPDEPFE